MKLHDEMPIFCEDIAKRLDCTHPNRKDFNDLRNFPLIPGKQCLYVADWKDSKITFQKGVKEMLGYNEGEFDMQLALNYFHPDDRNFVNRIIKGTVMHSIQEKIYQNDHYLNLTFRLRKKNGAYIKVIRKSSIYEADDKGRLISNFSMLTDIEFISNNNKVEWDIYTNHLDLEKFRMNVYKEFVGFFSNRELQIIKLLAAGATSSRIAENLFLSPNTVDTHRKNILRKSRCHNLMELLAFCNKNGIL